MYLVGIRVNNLISIFNSKYFKFVSYCHVAIKKNKYKLILEKKLSENCKLQLFSSTPVIEKEF